jgi:hypothetical protein
LFKQVNTRSKKSINQSIAVKFDGFIQMVEAGQQYDLKFKTPTSSFKNFLGIIPAAYASSLDNVKHWRFFMQWFCKGLYSDTTVPKFNIEIASITLRFNILIYLKPLKILLLTLIINGNRNP